MKMKQKVAKNVEEYIERFPNEVQTNLKKMRAAIKKAAPKAEEKIGYGMPAYTLNGILVYFAAYKNHIGLYPSPSGITAFAKDLAKYETSKGTIQFKIDKVVPVALITRIVKFRAKENAAKLKSKKRIPD